MLSQQSIDIVKSTVPVLEAHGKTITTVFYKNMFEAHPELLNVFNHVNQEQGRQQTALSNTVLAAAKHIDNLEAIVPAVVQIANKHVSLGIVPEQYPIVGKYLLGAIKEVLGDAATPEILGAWEEAYGVIADAFIGVEKSMYDQMESEEGGWKLFKGFVLADKIKESEVITSFYFKPVDGGKVPTYKPGQFISIKLEIPGEKNTFIRQYSLSQAPNGESFRISVKREADNNPNGKASVYLHDQLNVGDTVELSAPAGDFYLDIENSSPVTLISGGVGVTPMMAMYETVATTTPGRPVAFLHSSRTRSHQAFDKVVREMDESLESSSYAALYSEEGDGFINLEFLEKNVLEDSDVYVCGPTPFMQAVISQLYEMGIDKEKVHFEFFGPAVQLELAHS
ncbi:NO-inducible flavohemoprotein [Sporosarcina aquimarina]|uniref:Flavohemoprotein n=1 Tax=Sporosarcina aquimarina TaxID=114975 RepID=A0ABU4FZH9_9BACL|nr:NO-inducible flavohemoprotein [Sporosarcina aquimarina]MDW0110119.1 NO-inducible flavohemoprotein [Sporosarcina aquimarina]